MLRFKVLRELMAGFNANEPAPGTDDYYRMCVPYPVELFLSASDATADYTLHVSGIADYTYFSPGDSPDSAHPLLHVPGVMISGMSDHAHHPQS